ncbi:hypothetical protein ES705_17851 [subsurface metagenome]
MNKKIILKGVLLLIALAVLTLGFGGCGVVISTTGTVYISIANDNYWYNIYIDGVLWGQTNGSGNLTLYNVPIGNHYFQAYDISLWNLYGSKWQYITYGSNTVTIWVY